MLVKENTIPRKHVAAQPPASNANRADEPTNRRRHRILVIGAVIGVLGLFFGAAQAQVQNAELQLSYCSIVAPVSGRIAQKTVQTGNRVSVGQALLAVVEDDVWILANLKETQLERVRVGQLVDIKIDALPHYRFKGRVDSLQPGSGSNFALLPPDNATGNFIKIVQRVPVKILFDPESIKGVREKIVAGLSATPSIAVTEKVIDKPYQDGPETEQPSHQIASQPITQIHAVPATGVMQ